MSTEPVIDVLEKVVDSASSTFLGELRTACDHIEDAFADRNMPKALLWRARLRELCSDDEGAADDADDADEDLA